MVLAGCSLRQKACIVQVDADSSGNCCFGIDEGAWKTNAQLSVGVPTSAREYCESNVGVVPIVRETGSVAQASMITM